MSLVKWSASPLTPRFSNLIDGFFDDSNFFSRVNSADPFPATNVEEKDCCYILKMAVPGLKKEDINVEMDKNLLVISAKKESTEEEENKSYTRKEYSFTSFRRSFHIPEDVISDNIEATCKEGELTVEIPKSEIKISKPKSISVN